MGEFMGSGPPLEVAVVHHTRCGMGLLADEEFRHGFAARTGTNDADLAARAVTDPRATVTADVARLVTSPIGDRPVVVSGHVFDLATGLVTTVVPVAMPLSPGALA